MFVLLTILVVEDETLACLATFLKAVCNNNFGKTFLRIVFNYIHEQNLCMFEWLFFKILMSVLKLEKFP